MLPVTSFHKPKQFTIIWSNQNTSLPCQKIYSCYWWQLIFRFSFCVSTLLDFYYSARTVHCLNRRQKCARDCFNLQRIQFPFILPHAYLHSATSVLQIIFIMENTRDFSTHIKQFCFLYLHFISHFVICVCLYFRTFVPPLNVPQKKLCRGDDITQIMKKKKHFFCA